MRKKTTAELKATLKEIRLLKRTPKVDVLQDYIREMYKYHNKYENSLENMIRVVMEKSGRDRKAAVRFIAEKVVPDKDWTKFIKDRYYGTYKDKR